MTLVRLCSCAPIPIDKEQSLKYFPLLAELENIGFFIHLDMLESILKISLIWLRHVLSRILQVRFFKVICRLQMSFERELQRRDCLLLKRTVFILFMPRVFNISRSNSNRCCVSCAQIDQDYLLLMK